MEEVLSHREAYISDYAEMEDILMRRLKLVHYPIAVKFVFSEDELEEFKENAEYHMTGHPITYCQYQTGARMKGLTILGIRERMGCSNAAYVFGWKSYDESEIRSHMKYVRSREQAEKFIKTKPRLPEGKLLAFIVSPLSKTYFEPDVVHFYCDNLQSYHLADDYMAALDVHPLQFNLTMNSAVCGGDVWVYLNKTINVIPACSGSYTAGKTERGEVNVIIPGEHIGKVVDRLVERIEQKGGSSIAVVGDDFPGADICKNCPLIVFRKVKRE
ncbi:hypothetical protein DRP05_08775 [Archaeoglobales archaeon]|nr:MAG: hypothetical protein DRP05_08775 [Archaeoglobales archaeon]